MDDFEYNEETDSFTCPGGKELNNKGEVELNRSSGIKYQCKSKDCSECQFVDQCIRKRKSKNPLGEEQKKRNPARTIFISDKTGEENLCEEMREKIDEPVYRELYSRRMQIIEPVFANIKY